VISRKQWLVGSLTGAAVICQRAMQVSHGWLKQNRNLLSNKMAKAGSIGASVSVLVITMKALPLTIKAI